MKTCFAPASDPETDMVDHNKYYPTISHSMTIRHTAKVPVYTQSHKTTKNPSLQMDSVVGGSAQVIYTNNLHKRLHMTKRIDAAGKMN